MSTQSKLILVGLVTTITFSLIIFESITVNASINDHVINDLTMNLKPVGTVGQDWTLENILTDTQISFSNYKGKVILMDFFATWCIPCQDSMAEIRKIKAAFSSSELTIISVSSDSAEVSEAEIEAFAAKYLMDWKIVRDTIDLSTFYQINYIPTFYIFDQNQEVYYASYDSIGSSTIINKIQSLVGVSTTTPTSNPKPLGFWAKNWYWFAILTVFLTVFAGVFYQRRKVIIHNKKLQEEKMARLKAKRRKNVKYKYR
ncbi:MAG: redoxin domain-containing protein [Asgard group archaeon]|nr:redoxin domain-containing protein [Asgard group archaeon]